MQFQRFLGSISPSNFHTSCSAQCFRCYVFLVC